MGTIASESLVSVDPEVMGGVPVFRGSRVPIETLFHYLAAGDPLEEFLEDFPAVSREDALRLIDEAGRELIERHVARPA